MAFKGIFKPLIISILIIAFLNCSYADTNVLIGENQAKHISQDYLSSHNLPYDTTTVTWMMQIKNKKTGLIKWVSMSQIDNMAGNDISRLYEDSNFEWRRFNEDYNAWKVNIVNGQGKKVGSIWINSYDGKIIKIDLATANQNNSANNEIPSNQIINQALERPSSNNTWLIFSIFILLIAVGAGYFIYTKI